MPKRKTLRYFFTLPFAVGYILLFGEAFIRILSPEALIPRYVTGSDYGIRMNRPNSEFWHKTTETTAKIQYNSQGMRAKQDFDYQKDTQCRAVLLGDSFFAGFEVNFEDTFAYQLQKTMAEQNLDCEVINLAVSGFGTAESLIALQEEGLKYSPDMVILQWHRTDLKDNVRAGLFGLDDAGNLERVKDSYLPGVEIADRLNSMGGYRFLIENSQLYAFAQETIAKKVKAALVALKSNPTENNKPDNDIETADDELGDAAEFAASNSGQEKLAYAEELNIKLMRDAKAIAESHGAKFFVLEIPNAVDETRFSSSADFLTEDIREDLNFFTPLDFFHEVAQTDETTYFRGGHYHLTPLGNRQLTDYFMGQPLVKEAINGMAVNAEVIRGRESQQAELP